GVDADEARPAGYRYAHGRSLEYRNAAPADDSSAARLVAPLGRSGSHAELKRAANSRRIGGLLAIGLLDLPLDQANSMIRAVTYEYVPARIDGQAQRHVEFSGQWRAVCIPCRSRPCIGANATGTRDLVDVTQRS